MAMNDLAGEATGVQFTETMRGYFSTAETADCDRAAQWGRQENRRLEFTVTIAASDIDQFIESRFHEAQITGTVTAAALSAELLSVTCGTFNLFTVDTEQVNTRRMVYAMPLTAVDGSHYYLAGIKTIRDDPGFDVWSDTTTLRFQLFAGDGPSGSPMGAGILTISLEDFAHQLTTFKGIHARNKLDELRAIAKFGRFFAGSLYETYGGILTRPNIFNPSAPPRPQRPLDVPVAPRVYQVDAGDGVQLRLTRYQAGRKGPLLCVHGLGVSSKIFSTDLIDRNLVEEFARHGYDLWLLDYRSSIELPYAHLRYTGDDVATKDYPAAVRFIQQAAGVPSIQCLVHCYGATTFFMAMLAGLQGVRSAAVSQIAIHMKVPFATEIKTTLHAATILDRLGVQTMTAYVDTHEGFLGRLADTLLKLYPVHSGPRDISPVSRRISFLYGQLYELDQLNQRTYDNLHELFGVAGIASLEHFATMIRAGHVVDATGQDVYLRQRTGEDPLKPLAIPIAFAHGERNQCWLPQGTEMTMELLKRVNDPALYERKVFPEYGHIDCIFGKNAARDVYPYFLAHLEKTASL
jgi:cholesterol oxidase